MACCIQTTDNGENCASHLSARRRKEDEDRWAAQGVVALLNEGHKRGGRLHTKFYHFEEKFMSFGQTVVIWCFADFCRHKELEYLISCNNYLAKYVLSILLI